MIRDRYAVILVYSTSYAIRAEQILHRAGFKSKLIPVPRHLSSDCGVCVRFDDGQREAIDRILGDSGMEIQGIASTST